MSDVVSFGAELGNDAVDWLENASDEITDWFEDAADEAWPVVSRYLARKLTDPDFWADVSKVVGVIAVCVASEGAACAVAIEVYIQSEVVAAACAQAKSLAIRQVKTMVEDELRSAVRAGADGEAAVIRRRLADLDAQTQRIEGMSKGDRIELGAKVSAASPTGRRFNKDVKNRLLLEARALQLRDTVERIERAAQARLHDLYEEGRLRIESAGYTYWGKAGAFYPLDEFVQQRLSGLGPTAAFFKVVPPAAKGMARAEVRREFPSLRRLPSTVRAMTTVFISGGGLRSRDTGLTSVRSALAEAQRRLHEDRVGARANAGDFAVRAGAGQAKPEAAPKRQPGARNVGARASGPQNAAQQQGGGVHLDPDIALRPDALTPDAPTPDALPAVPASSKGPLVVVGFVGAVLLVVRSTRRSRRVA